MYKEICVQIQQPEILVVAVSKKQPIEKIEAAYAQGARHFGENYLQEAEGKIAACQHRDIQWHFIGALQSNKTRKVVQLFDWVQTVDRLLIAERLSKQRADSQAPLNMCLQVNIDRESQKAGCLPEDCLSLAQAVAQLPRLRLRGIMLIPKAGTQAQRKTSFIQARELFRQLQRAGHNIDTLSMGMSQDYQLAIQQGSTMVRIGTAIFGERPHAPANASPSDSRPL